MSWLFVKTTVVDFLIESAHKHSRTFVYASLSVNPCLKQLSASPCYDDGRFACSYRKETYRECEYKMTNSNRTVINSVVKLALSDGWDSVTPREQCVGSNHKAVWMFLWRVFCLFKLVSCWFVSEEALAGTVIPEDGGTGKPYLIHVATLSLPQ